MTALPPRADLTDNDMTAIRFSEAVAALRDYLAGLMGASGLPADALAGLGALVAGVLSRSAATTLGVEDRGRLVSCSGTWTLALPAAAAAGAGWAVLVANTGSGTVTLDPDGSETLDGAAAAALGPGRAALLVCTGTAWVTLALPGTAGGATLANDGSASAPALSFSADPDTGLYRVGADILGVSAGGAERLRVTAAGAQLTGLLTGTAVTQSQTDTTSGRLLKTGDGGLLGIAPPIGDASVTDNSIAPGFWRYDSTAGSSGGPSAATRGILLHMRRTSGGGEVQLLVAENSNPPGLLFTRSRVTGAWSDWRLHYGPHNVVGTVSFTGGAVSGAAIEAASNANGVYTRFADGTQICWRTMTASASAGVTWTFPAAFASVPAVTGTAVATVLSCVCLDAAPGTTSVAVSARDKTDARRADTIHLRAEGRWA
jgi:hypothetical protein